MKVFVEGILVGAGALALAQNLGDYRIDTEFMEYVFDPIKHFFLHVLGKVSVSKLELKGKALAHDAFAKLTNLALTGEADTSKVMAEVKKIAGEIKAAL